MIQRPLRRILSALLCVSAISAVAPSAGADDQAVPLKAQARSLFEEAKKLAGQSRYPEACPKFQESQRLDPGLGTKFYLADCLEHIGRYASAWGLYMEVADEAGEANMKEREDYAKKRADNLQPKLTRMVIVLSEDVKTIPGIEVRRDGVVVQSGQWGTPVPVDAGKHTVSVGAPSKRSWETTVEASGEGAVVSVTIPALKNEEVTPAPSARTPPLSTSAPAAGEQTSWPVQRTVALGVAGVGLVGLGLGIGFGLDAAGKVSAAKPECNDASPAICTKKGSDLLDGAQIAGTASTIGFIAGGALLAGGVVLFLTAPAGAKSGATGKATARSVWVAPAVGNTAGLVAGGAW